MRLFFSSKRVVCVAAALALMVCVPACVALSFKSNPEKQARKIESKLAKYPAGSSLHFYFRDKSDSVGSLGALSDTSFAFTNLDSNAKETRSYSDVLRVEKSKQYIGEGSAPRHRFLWVF
jgi:hypothetical protein